jgi:hypothetical protein
MYMKWKYFLAGGTIAGAFALGAMFAPINEPLAEKATGNQLPLVQTAEENGNAEVTPGNNTCRMTGGQMGKGAGMGMGQYFAGTMHSVISEALGMSDEELQAARSEGKSIADLAKEKGVKVEELVSKLMESRKAQLEQLVKDGKMTQEQMDAMLGNMEEMMKSMVERDTVGPMHGMSRGKGMMGQGGKWDNGTVQPQLN